MTPCSTLQKRLEANDAGRRRASAGDHCRRRVRPVNFLRIDRTDLLARHSHDFIATDQVAAEITDRYPDQRQRLDSALASGAISETRVTTSEEIELFGSLLATGHLGTGECSAIALAVHRRYILAIDDHLAATHARRADTTLRVLATQDLTVLGSSTVRPEAASPAVRLGQIVSVLNASS